MGTGVSTMVADAPALAVRADDGGQVHVGEHVAVEDDRDVVEVGLGVLHRAARAQRRLLDHVADALAARAAPSPNTASMRSGR